MVILLENRHIQHKLANLIKNQESNQNRTTINTVQFKLGSIQTRKLESRFNWDRPIGFVNPNPLGLIQPMKNRSHILVLYINYQNISVTNRSPSVLSIFNFYDLQHLEFKLNYNFFFKEGHKSQMKK